MRPIKLLHSFIILIFLALLSFGCSQSQKGKDLKPQEHKTCSVRGYLDIGDGQLVEVNTLRAITKDGINVTGDGDYFHGEECTIRIYRTSSNKAVNHVLFTYTASYSPLDLPKTIADYRLRKKPNIPNANPDDIYFKFPVLGDVKFIIKLKDNAGVDVGKE